MKTRIYLLLLFAYMIVPCKAQTSFFNNADLVITGVYYYPEQWDRSQWERDLKNMKAMGFEFTHMAEFSWAMLEPEEGKYDFKWLDDAIEIAASNGLQVIMCTPTPTPPLWLTKKYPEVLLIKEDGIQAKHGGREHFSWSSSKYRELSAKIVTELSKRYGKNPAIYGWQIDNEPSHYGIVDYGPEVCRNFQHWLLQKYKTINELNKAWGTAFWSQTYPSFEDIILPNAKTNVQQVNPHALLDFTRFNAAECADFITFQSKILRQYINKKQWVTTNFMDFHSKNDPWLNNNDLDFLSYTMYPVGGGYTNLGGLGEEGFRIGFPNKIAFANDFFRYKKQVTAVMELQPGQVNWGLYNPQTYPGIIRAWLWSAYIGGCDIICSYRYRQPLSGGEQYHYGMVGTDGVTPNVGGREYSQFMNEIKELRKVYSPKNTIPKEYAARKTAILWNWDNYWETEIQPQTNQWNPSKVAYKYHRALKGLGCPVDFISEDMDFSVYPTIVAPMYQLIDNVLIQKLKQYVINGGNLVLSARAGQKDRNAHLWELPYGKMIEELTGAKMLFYDVLPDDKMGNISMDQNSYNWNNWADVLEPQNNTEVWANYSNMFYNGKAAATFRKLGSGSVTYIGPDTDDGKLEKDILKKMYMRLGINFPAIPDGIMIDWRDGFWVAINYHSDSTITVPIPLYAKILIGNRNLKPADVVAWRE